VRDPRLEPHRGPLAVFAIFLAVVAGSAGALFHLKLGGSPDEIRAFYLGDEARFTPPRTVEGLLEVAIPHLAAMPLVVFTAAHLVAFAGLLRGPLALLRHASFGAALVGVAAGLAVRFVWPGVAALKLVAFLAFEATLVAWVALVAALLLAPRAPVTGSGPAGGRREDPATRAPRPYR
jgi:hypothetical protein